MSLSKKNKVVVKYFTIAEQEKEEKYLRSQHKKGWKFKGTFMGLFYRFTKCEPEDVVYQLDYNEEGKENPEEYIQMYQDMGWEYITKFVGYSYFRKPLSQMDGEEEIFSDASSKADMMKRIYKGRLRYCIALFFLIICPGLIISIVNRSFYFNIMLGLYGFIFVVYLAMFIKFLISYQKIKQMVR